MCGIVGLLLKQPALRSQLGEGDVIVSVRDGVSWAKSARTTGEISTPATEWGW